MTCQYWAPLSVGPPLTVLVAMTLASCVVVFLLAGEAAWRLEQRAWIAAAPLVAVAGEPAPVSPS